MKLWSTFAIIVLFAGAVIAAPHPEDGAASEENTSPAPSAPKRQNRRRGQGLAGRKQTPNCGTERKIAVSKCISKAQVLGSYEFVPPKDDEEFLAFCGQVNKSYKCGMKYVKECMTGLTAQMARVALRAMKQSQRSHCGGKRERDGKIQLVTK